MSQTVATYLLTALVVGMTVCAQVGCGSGAIPEKIVADAQSSFDAGMSAIENQEYEQAVESFTTAIEGAGLNPDSLSDAYLGRARAHLELGHYDLAAADLDAVEPYASNPAQVHQLRGELYLRQSNREKAIAEYGEARKINKRIPLPKELK